MGFGTTGRGMALNLLPLRSRFAAHDGDRVDFELSLLPHSAREDEVNAAILRPWGGNSFAAPGWDADGRPVES